MVSIYRAYGLCKPLFLLTIDITQWYLVGLGLIALFITASLLLKTIKFAHTYITFYFCKYVFYPQIYWYLRGSRKTTLFNMVLILAFLVGNVLYITVYIKDISRLTRRSRPISTINLILLLLGAQINLIASRCGIKLSTYV